MLSRAEHVQAVFHDSHLHHKAYNNDSGYFFGEILGKCVGLLSGNEWKYLRQEMDIAFNCKANVESTTSVLKSNDQFVEYLLSSEGCRNGSLDPAEDTMYCFFFNTAELMYGSLSRRQKSQLKEISLIRHKRFAYVLEGRVHRLSASKWLPTKANQDLSDFQSRWRNWNVEKYEASQDLGIFTPFGKWWQWCLREEIDLVQVSLHLSSFLTAGTNID